MMRHRIAFGAALLIAIGLFFGSHDIARGAAWPEKGKTLTILVPNAPGGGNDITARLLAPHLQQELGVAVQVVNKPGAGGQIAMTELLSAKPDGYTVSVASNPAIMVGYLDKDRKSGYTLRSFKPLVRLFNVDCVVVLRADAPYKTLKDLVEAGKGKPETIKVGVGGLGGNNQLAFLLFEQLSGARFAPVFYDGSGPQMTAILGKHIDLAFDTVNNPLPHVKGGTMRIIGVAGKKQSKYYPGVQTFEEQGYKIYMGSDTGIITQARAPQPAVEALTAAITKALQKDDVRKRLDDLALAVDYLGPEEYWKHWEQVEGVVAPLIPLTKQQ